jgi:hypothetical protein
MKKEIRAFANWLLNVLDDSSDEGKGKIVQMPCDVCIFLCIPFIVCYVECYINLCN